MTDILLIADQQRLHSILASASGTAGIRLRIATGLNQGVEEIATAPPALLFVQSRLSGLSGEIIARHVKSELKDSPTPIILFADVASEPGAGEALAVITLDLAISDRELEEKVKGIIAGPGPGQPAQGNSAAGEGGKRATSIPLAEVVTDSISIGQRDASAPTFQEELDSLTGRNAPSRQDATAAPSPSAGDNTSPFVSGHRKEGKNWLWPALVLLAAAAIALAVLIPARRQVSVKNAAPPVPPSAPVRPVPRVVPAPLPAAPAPKLPGFIPGNALDKHYGETHPGWERYVTATTEFKVYRERSALKALQVVDRSGEGVRPRFFTQVVQEMSGVRDYRLETKEQKGDYLIKKGRLSAKSRVILYKIKPDTILRAFVIYFE